MQKYEAGKIIHQNDTAKDHERRNSSRVRAGLALLVSLIIFTLIILVNPLVSEPAAAPDVSDSPFLWEKNVDHNTFEYQRPDADLPDIAPAQTPPPDVAPAPEDTDRATTAADNKEPEPTNPDMTKRDTETVPSEGSNGTTVSSDGASDASQTTIGSNSKSTAKPTSEVTTTRPTDPDTVIELPNDGKYFTTDIRDGATLDDPVLKFTIKHLKPEAVVESVSVQVNGILIKQFSGSVDLQEGRNVIRIVARYRENGTEVTAYDSYTVHYKKIDELTWETDLVDKIVQEPTFEFYVKVHGGTDAKQVKVLYGGRAIRPSGGSYSVTLQSAADNGTGRNPITVRISDTVDGVEKTYLDQTYVITYRPESNEETKPVLKSINVTDRMEILSDHFTVLLFAEDKDGNRIYADHIRLDVDGTVYPVTSQDNSYTGYQVKLNTGSNMLTVTVNDAAGRSATYRYELIRVNQNAKMTVQIEASTVGLGYMVGPVEYTLADGQKGSSVVMDVLQQHGFSVQHQGNVDQSFYLSRISKAGAFAAAKIPDDLLHYLEDDGIYINNQKFGDSLGDNDFTQGGGWLFQINGYYPGFALSDYYPQDGDVLRIRYSVAYGKDVGHEAPGTGKYKIYPKEW